MNALLPICLLLPIFAAGCVGPKATVSVSRSIVQDASAKDRYAVKRAAIDYIEALYDCKPEFIERSVHPKLTKLGFYRGDASVPYRALAMTYDQLARLAGGWNKDGSQANEDSPKKVEVLDLMDATAIVKVSAAWGVDHIQLAKFDGRWQIIHILWQSYPKTDADS